MLADKAKLLIHQYTNRRNVIATLRVMTLWFMARRRRRQKSSPEDSQPTSAHSATPQTAVQTFTAV